MSKRKPKLSSSKDWDSWIAVVRSKATGYQIWDLVDPSKPLRPVMISKPQEPELNIPEDVDKDMGSRILAGYKLHMQQYKSQLTKCEKQHASFTKLNGFIYDTITVAKIALFRRRRSTLGTSLKPSSRNLLHQIQHEHLSLNANTSASKQDLRITMKPGLTTGSRCIR